MISCLQLTKSKSKPRSDHHALAGAPEALAHPPAGWPEPSALVPRRSVSAKGRRPPRYPYLNLQVVGGTLGIDPTYLGRILNGKCQPSMSLATKLAAYMGWSIDQVNSLYTLQPKTNIKKTRGKTDGKSRNRSVKRKRAN